MSLLSEADALLDDHVLSHSDLQIDHFIVQSAGGVTEYGQYKQVLREIHTRTGTLRERTLDLEKAELDIFDAEDAVDAADTPRAKRRAEIELTKKRFAIQEAERARVDSQRELERFVDHGRRLKASLGVLTNERKAELEREMWLLKIAEYAALDLLTSPSLSRSTIEIIRSLPVDMRGELAHVIADRQRLFEWFESGSRALPPAASQDYTLSVAAFPTRYASK